MPRRIRTKSPSAGVRPRFKNHVRAWREFRELTQEQLVDKVRERLDSFSAPTLSKIENGQPIGGELKQAEIEALAWALECGPADLLEWAPTDPRANLSSTLRQLGDDEIDQISRIIATFKPREENNGAH